MKVLLKDIAEIQTGVFIKPNIGGDIAYLQASDFDEYGNHNGIWSQTISLQEVKEKHMLKKGDILYIAKGTKNLAVVRSSDLPLAVASTSFFVIRLGDDSILPEFMKWFLNQPETMALLKSKARGTAIASISKKVLENIQIPLVSLHKQQAILHIDQLRRKQSVILQDIARLKDLVIQQKLIKAINK